MFRVRIEWGCIRQDGPPILTLLPQGDLETRVQAPSMRQAGFTLLEVIVVVLIISLMAGAVAGMAYRQSDAFRLTLAGRQVYGFLRSARSFALLDERENPCLYDPETRELTEQARGKRLRLPDGVNLAWSESAGTAEPEEDREEGVPVARFYPDGSSDGSGVLLYAGRRELRLSLDPVFGWVRLEMQPQGAG
ncbi:prepilin-type N-terminal cleavage/methylation domain-containing protein [Desulfocurvibacter africanus PCS]|uniref:Prepilin-type N-terminal cleavage/methylation domain-containing protein n=1 Tax=Desulfocurvibacter africanus PCS TaxID=1262666 RepID=M5PYC8_DESAF|nr:prepilin-type N-terminal cleavage/methylation domain-containing protein [Desulfocurvibacter africanus]EMG39089.1 prepilin-type N-terminal cleavage/methylation domain-containing protein [Desulfocurvibacter africanus PCS]